MPNSIYDGVSPPFWFGRQHFSKTILISSLVEQPELNVVRPSTSLIGEFDGLEQSLLNRGVFEEDVCVRVHGSSSVARILRLFFDDDDGKKSVFALHTPGSQSLPPQRSDCGKLEEEVSKARDEMLKELVC